MAAYAALCPSTSSSGETIRRAQLRCQFFLIEEGKMTEVQSLRLVVGGELQDLCGVVFKDVTQLDVVGVFDDENDALCAWKHRAFDTVDNARVRYFIIPLDRRLFGAHEPVPKPQEAEFLDVADLVSSDLWATNDQI